MAGAELPREMFFHVAIARDRTPELVDCDTGIDDAMAMQGARLFAIRGRATESSRGARRALSSRIGY